MRQPRACPMEPAGLRKAQAGGRSCRIDADHSWLLPLERSWLLQCVAIHTVALADL